MCIMLYSSTNSTMPLVQYAAILLLLLLCSSSLALVTRRVVLTAPAVVLIPTVASAADTSKIVAILQDSKQKLEPIPNLLENMEWDKVRSILKVPPVNKLWNLGDAQNPLLELARETGNIDLFELKDELSYTLQMCDQYTYNNAFVYFQPGNGKYKIKEPSNLAQQAMKQIQQAIDMAD